MINLSNITNKISVDKEALSTLPRNNEKNINAYLKKVSTYKTTYQKLENEIIEEMKQRISKINEIEKSEELLNLEDEIKNTEGVIYLLNDIDTSYEKMDLDRILYNLNFYYKKNLEIVNDTILYCIKKFEEVGIKLTLKDFTYSKYVNEYINVFLQELENENINSKRIKSKFEEIYWKCPDIIVHIKLNIIYLYLKNEKYIDKYYNKQKEMLIKNFAKEAILNRYIELKKRLIDKTEEDKSIIINNFLSGNLKVKDYSVSSIESSYLKFISIEDLQEMNEDKRKEINSALIKLSNSLYEYKNYLKYKFIIDAVKEEYKNKEQNKNVYAQNKKEVSAKESKLFKTNNKINGHGILVKSNDKYVVEANNLILELKEKYNDLEKSKINDKIYNELDENSTILDVLKVASSFYSFLYKCAREEFVDATDEEINLFIDELREFVRWPYYTMLNNITMTDTKDLAIVIKDRYQLLNINIEKEELEEENLDSLISTIETIKMYDNLQKNNLSVDEIEGIYEFKKILGK